MGFGISGVKPSGYIVTNIIITPSYWESVHEPGSNLAPDSYDTVALGEYIRS
jgi:hypothetical protein